MTYNALTLDEARAVLAAWYQDCRWLNKSDWERLQRINAGTETVWDRELLQLAAKELGIPGDTGGLRAAAAAAQAQTAHDEGVAVGWLSALMSIRGGARYREARAGAVDLANRGYGRTVQCARLIAAT